MEKVYKNTGQGILARFNAKNLLLINSYYQDKRDGHPDVCTIILKDTSNGEKYMKEIPNPMMKIYQVKDEYVDNSYYPEFMEKSKCDEIILPAHSILNYINTVTTPELKQYCKNCAQTGNFYGRKKLHHTPCILGSDFPYENHFRIQWLLDYADKNINMSITKSFADIEVDSIDIAGVPEKGECPINAITMVDEAGLTCYTFLLRNKKNPQIDEFENNYQSFKQLCHSSFDESYGELEYKVFMFDEDKEIELIHSFFKLVNTLKRDFLLFWNMAFDIPYIMDRIEVLGYDPIEIMCSPDFEYPYCWYKHDRRNFDFKTRKDIFRLASYTVFQDQMINYCKVRKGQAELGSVKLNVIGKAELGDEKIDYSDEANIKTLPYVNYNKFVLYNIKDVLLQYGIEKRTKDLEAIFQRAYDNGTDYDSIFSQTIFLKNRVFLDYYREMNIIKGNNINIKYNSQKDDEASVDNDGEFELDEDGEPDWTKPISKGYEGALVGDPLNNSNEGEILYGKQSRFVFNNVIDFDFSSLYPSIIISHNIGQNPLVGKLILQDQFRELNQDPTNERYDPAKEFFEDYESENYPKMGVRWFGLPSTEELIKGMEDEFNHEGFTKENSE